MIQAVAKRRGMISRLRYLAKESLGYIPLFGWALILSGMIMVKRNWLRDQAELTKTFGQMKKDRFPIWLTTFVEGTRMSPKKLAESRKFCQERGKPVLSHCLCPRVKGFQACVQQLRDSHVKAIYDYTIAYSHNSEIQKSPLMSEILFGNPCLTWKFHIHTRRYPMESLPLTDKGLEQWLSERWVEKDGILDDLKENWTNAKSIGPLKTME